jgi:hypothetical protein
MKHWPAISAFSLCGLLSSASAQLSFTSGVDPAAGPNGNYAAVQFWNFSNSGGSGEFASGSGNNLYGVDYQNWAQQTWGISFTYDPTRDVGVAQVFPDGIGTLFAIPSVPASELQITVGNTGLGNLILTLTSIDSVANGGRLTGFAGNTVVLGGAESFSAGSTWSAANGTTLQAYMDNSTLFGSPFTLNGTITLDVPATSANYGDNLNSLIEFNLTSVPEPSTGFMFTIGLGVLACRGILYRRVKCSR